MAATVHLLTQHPSDSGVPLERAVEDWLLGYPPGTAAKYRGVWTPLLLDLAATGVTTVQQLDQAPAVDALTDAVTKRWGGQAPATWSNRVATIRSATSWWRDRGHLVEDPARRLRRRPIPKGRPHALPRDQIERLLTRPDLALRERTLWRLLYESGARTSEALRLDVTDLDQRNRRAPVVRKGGRPDVITWRTNTARLLPRLLAGRRTGPVFRTHRRAVAPLAAADLDDDGHARLSLRTAERRFTEATRALPGGPWRLHWLRHSALTHAAEDGASTALLQAMSGHADIGSLRPYVHVSTDALARWQADHDTHRR